MFPRPRPPAVPSSAQRPVIVERVKPVIVLNGGSSSGKTSIARCLQRLLGPTWLTLGVDDLVRALPGGNEIDDLVRAQRGGGEPVGTEGTIEIGPDGSVTVGDDFRRAEASWYAGVAAIGRCGTGLILDEVFIGRKLGSECMWEREIRVSGVHRRRAFCTGHDCRSCW
jgi:chloramphenicol 3-O phosphotransferase